MNTNAMRWVNLLADNYKALLVGMVVIAFGAMALEVKGLRHDLLLSELRVDSVEAVADTTRLVSLLGYSDSTRIFQRRAVQLEELNDELGELLGQQIQVSNQLRIQLDNVSIVDTTTIIDSGDTLKTAIFSEYREPITFDARIEFNLTQNIAAGVFKFKIDPLILGITVGCQEGPGGLLKAFANVEAPLWANVTLSDVRQSVEVCNRDISPSIWESIGKLPMPVKVGVPLLLLTAIILG